MPTSSPGSPATSSHHLARRLARRGDDRGVSSIELAVIAPSLLLLIFLVIQAALFFYARSVALQSAREGVAQLRLYGGNDGQDCADQKENTRKATVAYAQDVGSGALSTVRATPHCYYKAGGNSRVMVRVNGSAISLIGLKLGIQEQATGRLEQFQRNG